jgi:hypothetical protein
MRSRPPPNRRLFLRSAAATLALPLLPSALPRVARADAEAPKRMLFWYVPNGVPKGLTHDEHGGLELAPDRFTPTAAGAAWYEAGVPDLLAPLADLAPKVNVLSGLDNDPVQVDMGGDHAVGTGTFLTCFEIHSSTGNDIDNGVSCDQQAALATAGATPFASIQLGMEAGGSTGECNAGYSCAYMRNLAWSEASTPLPNITDPAIAFQLLFPGSVGVSPDVAARRAAMRGSVLDYVLDEANRLDQRVGYDDHLKLDQYLTAVREVEQRIDALGPGGCGGEPPQPTYDVTALADLFSDLQVLALQCDITRLVTFMLGNSQSTRVYDFLGVTDEHHAVSHHKIDLAMYGHCEDIATWEIERFGYLLRALDGVLDVNGATLLDNCGLYFSSEIQQSNYHTHTNMPVLVAGSMGGTLVTGQHLDYRTAPRSVAQLFLALLEAYGTPVEDFGDARGVTLSDMLL